RFAVGQSGRRHEDGGVVPDGNGSAAWRGACCLECDKPSTGEFPGEPMKRCTAVLLSMMGAAALAGCAGSHTRVASAPAPSAADASPAATSTTDSSAVQLGTALATVEQ